MTSHLALSISMPNLPGMTPNKQAWVYREKEGFKKSGSRPSTAHGGNHDIAYINQTQPDRPYTNNEQGRFPDVEFYKDALQHRDTSARPKTAGVVGYRGATPIFTSTDFNPTLTYGNDPKNQSRPGTGVPRFVEMDKQVIRFYAHFFQDRNWDREGPLGDPVLEKEMCRFVTIQYYLVDDEVQILEPKVINAGLPTGTFYRKGPLEKTDGERLKLEDLIVGGDIHMLGQEFFITDADEFTRKHFREKLGIELLHALPRPKPIRKDIGAQYATGLGAQLPKVKTSFGTRSTDYMNTKEILDKTNRFLRYEGRVLRFLCVEVKSKRQPFFPDLQEKAENEGYFGPVASASVKRFALSFYLSTSNIDLVVQKVVGRDDVGQDEPKLVLKKSKLPMNWRDAQRGRPAKYFEPQDFRCGEVIDVFGRYFLLVACDRFTRHVYEEMGAPQVEVRMIAEPKQKIVQPVPQLGDGFLAIGSNEDTLATVYGMPKPGKDLEKIQRNQNRLLRCKAAMLSRNAIDSTREFMITFYLEDDTIAVYEEVKRNSGIWGGNFLKRGKYMNNLPNDQQAPRYFKQNDIYLGNVISFNGNDFQVIEMDNMSLEFCEHYPDEFPMMDTFKIIGHLMKQIVDRKLNMRPIFRRIDPNNLRYVDQTRFVEILDSLSLTDELNDQEILTIMRRFKDGDHCLYEELCDLISHIYGKNRALGTDGGGSSQNGSSTKKKGLVVDTSTMENFRASARVRTIQWRRTFRKDPQTLHGYITLSILEKLLRKHGLPVGENICDAIRNQYAIDRQEAGPILKELQHLGAEHLYDGLDQKVRPKKRHSNASTASFASSQVMGLHALARRNNSLVGSVLRQRANSFDADGLASVASDNQSYNPASVLIDYSKLCDDIYICDWM